MPRPALEQYGGSGVCCGCVTYLDTYVQCMQDDESGLIVVHSTQVSNLMIVERNKGSRRSRQESHDRYETAFASLYTRDGKT